MRFRPCIDLHEGKVKQIVGSTLSDEVGNATVVNFSTSRSAGYYARRYREDGLEGGHVIMLGPGNEEAAQQAVAAYPEGLQVGGGINLDNARQWLDAGAAKVIVTSFVFRDGQVDWQRLAALKAVTGPDKLVLDLSCRAKGKDYFIVTDRWQLFTHEKICAETLARLGEWCSEFLVHAVDVEGKQSGVDEILIPRLAEWSPVPVTYAGGIRHLDDLYLVEKLGQGRIDATAGSALDIFGGRGLRYRDAVAFDQERRVK